jgi:hypothetical protein
MLSSAFIVVSHTAHSNSPAQIAILVVPRGGQFIIARSLSGLAPLASKPLAVKSTGLRVANAAYAVALTY